MVAAERKFDNRTPHVLLVAPVELHRNNHHPVDRVLSNAIDYPLDRDICYGWHYPIFGQLEPNGFKVCFARSFKFTRLEEMMLSVKDEKTPVNSSQNPFSLFLCILFFFAKRMKSVV